MTKPEHHDNIQATIEAPLRVEDASPPDGGYGWVCCLAMFSVNGGTWGILASFGTYLSYYLNNKTFPGASALDYSLIGGLNFCAALIGAPLVNILVKRFGTNRVMLGGCIIFLLGFLLAAEAVLFWHLLLTQGLLVGIGAGLIWLPAAPVLAQWFSTKRSLAQGIASSGSGIVGIIFSVSTAYAIDGIGLAWTLRVTGLTSTVLLLLGSILIKDRNKSVKPNIQPFSIRLLRQKGVLLLMGFTVFNILAYITCIYSFGAFAISIGSSQSQGGIVVAMVNLGTALVRPLVGVISDKLGRITTTLSITAFNSILVFAFWLQITSFAPLIVFALIIGGTGGIYWGVIAPLCAEVVPLVDLPSLLALMWLTVSLPALFSEAIALEIRKNGPHEFLYTEIYTGLSFAISSIFLFELRRMKWGLRKRETHGT